MGEHETLQRLGISKRKGGIDRRKKGGLHTPREGERMARERAHRRQKGQGQEQAEMLALEGEGSPSTKEGRREDGACRWRWNARIVGGGWTSSFQGTSLFLCELGGEVIH